MKPTAEAELVTTLPVLNRRDAFSMQRSAQCQLREIKDRYFMRDGFTDESEKVAEETSASSHDLAYTAYSIVLTMFHLVCCT